MFSWCLSRSKNFDLATRYSVYAKRVVTDLDIEQDFIVVYKEDAKLNKSGCLGLESAPDVDLGPLLNVEATCVKLKVRS